MLYKKTETLSIIRREGEIMGMFVNPNAAAFQCAVNSEVYIDKTGLLEYTNKVLGTNARFICNSRPRRFGKSVTVDMLTAYYSKGCDTEKMFSGLEISRCPDFYEHLNKYDVIHFDVQWCCISAGSSENLISYITNIVVSAVAAGIHGGLFNHAVGFRFARALVLDQCSTLAHPPAVRILWP